MLPAGVGTFATREQKKIEENQWLINIQTQFELWFKCETYLQVLFTVTFKSSQNLEFCQVKNDNLNFKFKKLEVQITKKWWSRHQILYNILLRLKLQIQSLLKCKAKILSSFMIWIQIHNYFTFGYLFFTKFYLDLNFEIAAVSRLICFAVCFLPSHPSPDFFTPPLSWTCLWLGWDLPGCL